MIIYSYMYINNRNNYIFQVKSTFLYYFVKNFLLTFFF